MISMTCIKKALKEDERSVLLLSYYHWARRSQRIATVNKWENWIKYWQNRPQIAADRRKVILLHDYTRPFDARSIVGMRNPLASSLLTRHWPLWLLFIQSYTTRVPSASRKMRIIENGSMNRLLLRIIVSFQTKYSYIAWKVIKNNGKWW